MLADQSVVKSTTLVDDEVVGSLVCFGPPQTREVGYWVGRAFWGRHIATDALQLFLADVPSARCGAAWCRATRRRSGCWCPAASSDRASTATTWSSPRSPSLRRMAFVRSRGVDVHYVAYGASREWAEHTVVVLHGYTLDHRSAQAVFEPAFRSGQLATAVPRPPRAWTAPRAGVGRVADDVLDVTSGAVDELVDGPYALAGISYGGYIAAGLVAADPDRVTGLALVVPMVRDRPDRDLADFAVLRRDVDVVRTAELDEMAVVQTAEVVRRIREEIDAAVELADEAVIERLDARYAGSFPLSPPGGYERPPSW